MNINRPLIGCFLLLAGCTPTPEGEAVPPLAVVEYTCPSGVPMRVSWWKETAELTYGDGRWMLPRALSGSGARYADGAREVWEHQGSVRVTIDGSPPEECRPVETGAR
ncbi:MAG: MliC family protein [Rhodospirillales bacterium]|nr:MliC family protein [Rhodospirillales bacterium]MCW8951812.1 MliC family protein [Rhodospirillales bacterium]MCW9003296.1 MliC family protein [Rhodospirillales bacterium]MCW9040965.1 MliC family protein [Rhodospirillales bacterium]